MKWIVRQFSELCFFCSVVVVLERTFLTIKQSLHGFTSNDFFIFHRDIVGARDGKCGDPPFNSHSDY